MVSSRIVRLTLLALVMGVITLVAPDLAVAGPPTAHASGGPSADPAATRKPHGARRLGEGADVTLRLHDGRLTLALEGRPRTTYRVFLEGRGALRPQRRPATLRTDGRGRAARTFAVRRTAGDRGGVVATVRGRNDVTLRSVWTHRVSRGRWVTASTELGARVKALRLRHPDGAARRAALARLWRAPARAVRVVDHGRTSGRVSPASDASTRFTITGHVQWRDYTGAVVPARHVMVDVTDLSSVFGPITFDRVWTDDNGYYSTTYDPAETTAPSRDFEIDVWADDGDVARVTFPMIGTYHQTAQADDVAYGHAVSIDYTAPNDTQFGQAYAIHDALWSAHQFAVSVGDGGEDLVPVLFPDGADDHAAVQGPIMSIGAFEWSSWEVINHEYGHWYDGRHDISGLIGGDHCAAPLASDHPCVADTSYNKDEGTQLAWSEGFADFYSQSAAHHAPVPPALTQELRSYLANDSYDDLTTTSPGHTSDTVTFPAGRGAGEAEDDESSVAGVLRTVLDDVGPTAALNLVKEAGALRLSDFLAHAWPSDELARVGDPADLGCSLADSGIAPGLNAVFTASQNRPPALSWSAGNFQHHENRRFVVDAFTPGSPLPLFTSSPLSGTSWTPTPRDWTAMIAAGNDVELRVTGWQDDDPATGPFRGCRITVHVGSDPAPLDTSGCRDVTLPANDDGSTGAVPLPFPVDFFGTTYTDAFVNNNGNITFNAPMWTYTPFTLDASTPPIIAPFFADVDTRGSGSAPVTYSYGTTTFKGRNAWCVDWFNVGYFADHDDKLNSFQLLLVDRSDVAPGDFDIVFNYGPMLWETGDASGGIGGYGGTPAAVGYSAGNGASGSFFQLPGSLETGRLIAGGDNDLAVYTNDVGHVAGRQVYKVRNGSTGNSATGVEGQITSAGLPAVGAIVQVCPVGGGVCAFQTRTGSTGRYDAVGIPPGDYVVKAYPPGSSTARPTSQRTTVVDQERSTVDLDMVTTAGPPPGTTISPQIGTGRPPMVDNQTPLSLATAGCVGGSASYLLLGAESPDLGVWAEGSMTADADGAFTATIPTLAPHKGSAQVSILIQCPGAGDRSIDFDLYVDPSGSVVDQDGRPVSGAVVTLETSDTPDGPFQPVPDGSATMSPANRQNPVTTDATGHFGWDVIAGYYRLSATREGCVAPGGGETVHSAVLTVPPPVVGLDLVLSCPRQDSEPPTLEVTARSLEGNATGGYQGVLDGVTAHDNVTSAGEITLTNDAPSLLPLGVTRVRWTATDAAGNAASAVQVVTVVDTTAPRIACPPDVRTAYTAAPVLGRASAMDVVDPAPRVSSNAPSAWGLGTTDVTWRAEDARGNVGSCVQHVTLSVATAASTAAGDQHSLALRADGTVLAWGSGGNGQLGRGTTTSSTTPVVVPGLTGIRSVAAGGLFSLALRGDGSVWAWGDNGQGQVGVSSPTTVLVPTRVPGLPPIRAITAGRFHAVAVGLDGSVWTWGANTFGQLGRASTGSAPAQVDGATDVVAVAAGAYHSVALRADGTVLTWGAGYAGQLGDGTTPSQRSTPAVVPGLSGVAAIGAGALDTVAVTASGSVRTWGDNASGQIGDGTTTRRTSPVAMTGACLARAADGGEETMFVLCRDGRVLAVGKNASGELGDGTTTNRKVPIVVTGLTAVTGLAVGAAHSVAATGATASSWGQNRYGQLGIGNTVGQKTPVAIGGVGGLMPIDS